MARLPAGSRGYAAAMDADAARGHLEAERKRLQHVKDTIDGEGIHDAGEEDALSELSHVDQHPADVGSETFEREKEFSILERVEVELDDVERAIRRLEEGTYGICEACHQPIGDERLEAQPAARFCVEHQRTSEGQYDLRR